MIIATTTATFESLVEDIMQSVPFFCYPALMLHQNKNAKNYTFLGAGELYVTQIKHPFVYRTQVHSNYTSICNTTDPVYIVPNVNNPVLAALAQEKKLICSSGNTESVRFPYLISADADGALYFSESFIPKIEAHISHVLINGELCKCTVKDFEHTLL